MGRWKLWFVLLLQLTFYVYSEETGEKLVKTIGKERDVTPICTNATMSVITLIVCTIRKEKSGEECRLLYRYGEDFEHECDSRVTLVKENQTVFLHLIDLRPEDSGNYTCQCTSPGTTHILRLNITVEEDENEEDADARHSEILLCAAVIGAFISITITGVILGFICRKVHHRQSEPLTSHANTEPDYIEPYSSYIQRENSLYSTIRMH